MGPWGHILGKENIKLFLNIKNKKQTHRKYKVSGWIHEYEFIVLFTPCYII